MTFRSVALSFLLLGALRAPVMADAASDLWTQGKYDEAMKQGLAENTPDGIALAARAAVSDMMMHTTPCTDCVSRAEDLSRKALAAEPKAVYPTLCLAAALGYRGRIIGLLAAQNAKLGETSKQAIEDALAAHPRNAELLAAMGGWNFEVVRVGGSMLASLTYGASMDEGLKDYDEALKLAPNDILVNYQYGLGLAADDPDEYRDKIVAAWKRVVAAPSQGAYEDTQKKRAGELLALLGGNDRNAFDAKVKSYMGIPQ